MAPPTKGQLIFAREGELDRTAGAQGEKRRTEIPGTKLHLAAEAAADVELDHPHVVFGDPQGAGEQGFGGSQEES